MGWPMWGAIVATSFKGFFFGNFETYLPGRRPKRLRVGIWMWAWCRGHGCALGERGSDVERFFACGMRLKQFAKCWWGPSDRRWGNAIGWVTDRD